MGHSGAGLRSPRPPWGPKGVAAELPLSVLAAVPTQEERLRGARRVLQPRVLLCFSPPPPPSSSHVCGWIPRAVAWLGCKPLIDSFRPHQTAGRAGVWTAHPRAPRPQEGGRGARDPIAGCSHPKTFPTPCPGGLRSVPGDPVPSFGSLSSLSGCCLSLLEALGPFPSPHRSESSLLSSPAGGPGWRPNEGSLTWHRAGRAPGRILLSAARPSGGEILGAEHKGLGTRGIQGGKRAWLAPPKDAGR